MGSGTFCITINSKNSLYADDYQFLFMFSKVAQTFMESGCIISVNKKNFLAE